MSWWVAQQNTASPLPRAERYFGGIDCENFSPILTIYYAGQHICAYVWVCAIADWKGLFSSLLGLALCFFRRFSFNFLPNFLVHVHCFVLKMHFSAFLVNCCILCECILHAPTPAWIPSSIWADKGQAHRNYNATEIARWLIICFRHLAATPTTTLAPP